MIGSFIIFAVYLHQVLTNPFGIQGYDNKIEHNLVDERKYNEKAKEGKKEYQKDYREGRKINTDI